MLEQGAGLGEAGSESDPTTDATRLKNDLEQTRRELDEIMDAPNNTQPTVGLRRKIDELEAQLEAMGVDPEAPTEEEVAEARQLAGRTPEVDETADTADPTDSTEYDPNQ